MTKDQLRTILEAPYDQTVWLQTLREIFGHGNYYARPSAIGLPANELAEAAYELGSFETAADQRLVGVYEVVLKPGVRIESKRVVLRQLLRQVYKLVDGALVVFTGADDKWRFSYVSEIFTYDDAGNRQVQKTETKRYTYVLGRGTHARTPTDRFARLMDKRGNGLSLKDITEAFSVDALTKDFYRELSDWYFWARGIVQFPDTALPREDDNDQKHREKVAATSTIRLITRLMFIWFIKQKGLVPDELFNEAEIKKLIKGFQPQIDPGLFVPDDVGDSTNSTYYKAILQNLFFATLNTDMSDTERRFKKTIQHLEKTDYRYRRFFNEETGENRFLELIRDVPFLNGGLFDCLDQTNDKTRVDCFSDRPQNEPLLTVPDYLFFGEDKAVNLNAAYGDTKHGKQVVRGLIPLLNRYNFTVEENTPVDVEVALDPELLGKVFENLLASYNPETETTARKQTGSFYTPREIVEYMVDESLKAYLTQTLSQKKSDTDFSDPLNDLFNYSSTETTFDDDERKLLVEALYDCKILDPACGSGAFPLGVLQRMVHLLSKLDPENDKLKEKAKAQAKKDFGEALDIKAKDERDQRIEEIEQQFRENTDDYNRKLVLIEQCLHGVDIQPIAVQITKLRFFISLVVEQEPTQDRATNRGIRPLPNLETKFVAANTLIGLEPSFGELFDTKVKAWEDQLRDVRHRHFRSRRRKEKLELRRQDEAIRTDLTNYLHDRADERQQVILRRMEHLEADIALMQQHTGKNSQQKAKLQARLKTTQAALAETQKKLRPADELLREISQLAGWNPYDQSATAPFYDSKWMFDVKDGFDVVIGNPPYISHDKFTQVQKLYYKQNFETFEPYADLYIYFIEKSLRLCNKHGYTTSITSNSFLKSDYGTPLRKLATDNTICQVINIKESQVFESATVNVSILMLQKGKIDVWAKVVNSNLDYNISFSSLVDAVCFKYAQTDFLTKTWSLLTPKGLQTMRKIERDHKTVEELGVKIRLGVATGDNDAFVINESKRDALVKQDPKNSDIIKPILRGRDISKYSYKHSDSYIILTQNGINVEKEYPTIYKYFDELGDKFKSRGAKGKHWTNLRACSFFDDFKAEKIIWIELSDEGRFALSSDEMYLLNSSYFLLPPSEIPAKYLLSILNSHVIYFYLQSTAETSGMGTNRWFNNYVKEFPIPAITLEGYYPFIRLVDYLLFLKAQPLSLDDQIMPGYLEGIIDGLVYELYFPDELHRAGCRFHEHLRELPDVTIQPTNEAKLNLCRRVFAELYHTENPVRLALFKLDTVPEVAIIEGKQK